MISPRSSHRPGKDDGQAQTLFPTRCSVDGAPREQNKLFESTLQSEAALQRLSATEVCSATSGYPKHSQQASATAPHGQNSIMYRRHTSLEALAAERELGTQPQTVTKTASVGET